MPARITHEDLMRFIDGELSPEERVRVEAEVSGSSELQREVAIFRAMKGDFQELTFHPATYHRSVWDQVNAHVARPVGWLLVVVGVIILMVYGGYVFATSPVDPWEKLAAGAVVIGILTLLASVIWERYREWLTDPYKDVQR